MKGFSSNTKALYAVIGATVVGGGLAVFGKIGLQVIPPFAFTFLRFVIGSIFLTPFLTKFNKLTPKKFTELFLLSLLSTINLILFSFGIRLTTATISQLLYSFVPILVSILSIWLLNRKPSMNQIGGILLGLLGIGFLVLGPLMENKVVESGNGLGNFLIMIGTILYSLYLIYSKKLQKNYSPATLTGAFIGTTLIASGIMAIFENSANIQWVGNLNSMTIVSLLYVGVLGTGIFYFLNQYAVKHGGPLAAAVIQYTTPPATLILAMFFLQEKITFEFIIGSFLAYFSAWLVTSR